MNQTLAWHQLQQRLKERLTSEDFRAWIVPLRVVHADTKRIVLDAPNDRFVAILEESLRSTIDDVAEQAFGSDFRVEISAAQLALGGLTFSDGHRSAIQPPASDSQAVLNVSAAADRSTPRDVSEDPASTSLKQPHRPEENRAAEDRATKKAATEEGATVGRVEVRRTRQPRAALVASTADLQPHSDQTGVQSNSRESDSQDGAQADLAATGSSHRSAGRIESMPAGNSVPKAPLPMAPKSGSPRFNPKYRFSNFVVGDSNQFACAAARAVAESPGQSYNPLFLYGGVGLGKTHLLHAIAQEILHGQPELEVHYISAEQFLNELINSIRFDRMPLFRERYRSIDVLLIDDIQFLANKERTQEEFFHTFNALYTAEKQIILSSDASPKDIPTLEERLRSRFEWGLITDIQPPDLETKVAILRRKAALRRCELDDEVAMFIASQVRSNVRELEGLLNRVIAFSSMTGRPLDIDLARETLKEILPQADARRTAAEIIRTVAKAYGLKVSEIKSKNKAQQISFPRQVAMYLCKQLTDLSFPEIGKQFSNKHHSTVMHSVEKITKLRADDSELDRLIERLVLQLR